MFEKLVQFYCQNGQIEASSTIIDRMEAKPPAVLFLGHAKQGQVEREVILLRK